MPQIVFTPEELRARFTGMKKSLIYDKAVQQYNRLRLHADGDVPIHLIRKARPNESEEVREYRECIYEPETQNPIERVLGVLEKIRRSPDWMMRYDNPSPEIIRKDETLEKYLCEHYPTYQCFENWLFEEGLKSAALDANAVIAVIPQNLEVSPTEYLRPIALIFNSKQVIDFVTDSFAVLKSDELSSLLTPERQQQRLQASAPSTYQGKDAKYTEAETFVIGQVYYVITTDFYQKWEENIEGKFQLTKQFIHGLGALPAFQMPGKFVKRIGEYILKRTPLAPMVPHLNKAARESNDLDAGVIMHLFLEKWRINNVPCGDCSGTGKRPGGTGTLSCGKCSGTGMDNGKSPFSEVVVKPASIGQQNVPTPPLGYVEKNPEIIKVQNERVERHIYKALQSVNMEHLAEVQLNQSGVAKQYDRDEVNNLISTFAETLCQLAQGCIYWIAELRYRRVVPDAEKRKSLLPIIPVPEKFDVINSSFLLSEYQVSKNAGMNSIILAELQKEIAQKKFYANPKIAAFVQTVMDLDPFPDKTVEEKGALAAQGLATREDIILSNYISDFVKIAQEQDKSFSEKTVTQKREVLIKLAQEKVALLDTAKKLAGDIEEDEDEDENDDKE